MNERFNEIGWVVRQRALYVGILLWLLLCGVGLLFSRHTPSYKGLVVGSSKYLVLVVLMFGLVALLTRKLPVIDLAQHAPKSSIAQRETLAMWAYAAVVMVAGRLIGQHLFGEGIALHLNGSLVGATRVQSPIEVYTWAAYNGVLLALIPYVVFRMRGYSNEQLNLKSANLKSDLLVIVVVLAFSAGMDMMGSNIFQLTRHQQLVGGLMSFWLHLFGTDLPIMIVIYSILMPRYFKLFSPMTAYLFGALSYPTIHIFESGTRYDSIGAAAMSLTFVYLLLLPAGLMKSFLTWRTGNAWVHVWAYHAISPHVTVDTRLIVSDFRIK
jgi:magnesium-transporting ATPase (P-type)